MGVLNNIFRWFILDRMRQIETLMEQPHQTQSKVLTELISGGAETEWGKEHQYSKIKDLDSFRKNIPLQDYNSLEPYINKMMSGAQNVLWSSQINWFAKSSGTTQNKSKFLPISKESLNECHIKSGKDIYAMFYNLFPDANLVDGKTLGIGGSHQIHQLNDSCSYGDLSAVILQHLPIWAQAKRTPDLSIALMDNWEDKIEKMANAVIDEDITNILGVPTWTIVLFKKIFELTGKNNISDIWPNLQLYVHGGVSFKPYQELFSHLISNPNMFYMETYNASEGFFSMQNDINSKEMLLMLDYGIYYEFIEIEDLEKTNPNVLALEEVKTNINYAIVISTNAGLWRYVIGDTIKFTSLNPYKIVVSGRTKHFINAFGEELIIENADSAIQKASEKTSALVSDYTAAPIFFSDITNGAHEWLIEFEKLPYDIDTFIKVLDETLKFLNSDYEAKRYKNIALGEPIIKVLPPKTFEKWLKSNNKLGGQHKIPRLSNTRIYVEEILKLIDS